jgi:hypothetical protein
MARTDGEKCRRAGDRYAKGALQPLNDNMGEAATLAALGLGRDAIAEKLGVNPSTVTRWFKRDDVKALRTAALADVVAGMIPKAYAVLQAQLEHSNPWVAQGAARELIRLYNLQQGASDANVVVTFGSMPTPGAPGSAGHMAAELPSGDEIDADFVE